jgi:menaquinone-dependent protoporphyrinogen oxidase
MDQRVLVTFATKHGATGEIAARIGQSLQEAGLATDVVPTYQVGDISPYTAVVLGSAVYIGRWRKQAVKFLQDHKDELKAKDVWLFSSGPTGTGDPEELLKGWRVPENVQPVIDDIRPRDIAVFHGVLNPDDLNFLEKWTIKTVKAETGDFRDWDAISAWAMGIASQLQDVKSQATESQHQGAETE